jgi:Winged helix DNA-binding domain
MKNSVEWSQVSAFRLARHHFLDQQPADLVEICSDLCGVQAQVMSAARMALWARNHSLTQSAINSALNEGRTLVRTSCMRQTLHLLSAADFSIFIMALKPSRVEAIRRVASRFGVTENDTDRLNQAVVDALSRGPATQRELTEQIKAKAGKRIRAWMGRVWSVFRLAMVEGLICYGPDRGKEATLVRVDQWLPLQRQISEQEAKQVLLRRYLSAYGPATLQDFSKWSGISMKEATPIWRSLDDEYMDVRIDDKTASLLREDCEQFLNANLSKPVLRLLPSFDPYMLAHAEKNHIVDAAFYKRVYRDQWWISPVVLLNGRVIGVWSLARQGKGSVLEVELFQKATKTMRARIEEEAASVGAFLGVAMSLAFG